MAPRPVASRRALLALALAVALIGWGCGGGGDGGGGGDPADDAGPPPGHVHGLGVNPGDGALYIATHTGLFRMPRGGDEATRVGASHQDTMGFAVAGPDRFLGSGHPDPRDDLPPLLGLIESEDAGRTWRGMSLLGDADFHALRVRGSRVVGYDAGKGRLMSSNDGGRTWRTSRPPAELGDVAIDPADERRYVASSAAGLLRSDDAGARWSKGVGDALLFSWPVHDALYGIAADGTVEVSRDGGATWRRVGDVGGEPAAVTAKGRDELIAALHDGRVVSSADGGATWSDGAWADGA